MRKILYNPFSVQVKFSDRDLAFIEEVAEQRQSLKTQNLSLVNDKRIIQRDNVKTHFIGLLGEFALARLVHGKVDKGVYLKGDTRKDFELYGVSIEVKTLQGYLTFKRLDDFVSDVAVLVVYRKDDYSSVKVEGWISRHDFKRNYFIDDFGYGKRPCVQPSQLLPINTLKTYCLNTQNLRFVVRNILGERSA